MMTNWYNQINILLVFTLAIMGLLILIKIPNSQIKSAILFFIICLECYLAIEWFRDHPLFYGVLSGPFLLPFAFWLLANRMFSDEEINGLKIGFYGLLICTVQYCLYFLNRPVENQYYSVIAHLISLFFVVLALYEAQNQLQMDLVEKRKKLRSQFTYMVAAIVFLTLIVELSITDADLGWLKLAQRTTILGISLVVMIKNISITKEFFGKTAGKSATSDPDLIDKIQKEVSEEGLYRKESLTIGQLADHIGEQEYKVRRCINQDLGYRNFTDFINSFRIGEAKAILADPSKKEVTIMEIAYKTGFNSIGPFNKAFKRATGMTPTLYRKSC